MTGPLQEYWGQASPVHLGGREGGRAEVGEERERKKRYPKGQIDEGKNREGERKKQ